MSQPLPIGSTHRMSRCHVAPSPATGGFRGNGRQANLEE